MHPATRWVQRLLEQHDLKATHLARMAGVAPSTLTRALNEQHSYALSNYTLRKVASALKIQVPNGILADEDSCVDDERICEKMNLPEGRVYVAVPANLSDESRRKVELLFASLIDTKD